MALKPKPDSFDASASKKRKAITMEVKLDIIKRYDKGERATDIGRSLGLSRSTVATIIKNKDRILEHVRRLGKFEALKREKGEESESEKFVVSRSWFMRFKDRANFHNIKVQGEAASGDDKAAREFPKALAQIIVEGDYCAQQMFNVDETGLFWKRLPNRTYVSKE
ncbi:tigger transposable element-derived protein 1-like [Dendropsophus ebraccatus]|uniref:tigger transposable element-derived protein 1-like n=1 Tax=Dendropsophus ebraccatus TaxID=150705 RepID=UPI00383157E4